MRSVVSEGCEPSAAAASGRDLAGAERLIPAVLVFWRRCSAVQVRGWWSCGNVLVVDTGGDQGIGWDFFVSYTQADRAWAEWIAWELEEAGHRVLVQAWDFVPGSNWIQSMQEGVSRAERTITVLSREYLESRYAAAEWQKAWADDPGGKQRKLLVVRIAECHRPGLLSGVVSIDVFGISEAKAKARLRTMVSAALSGRAKPAEQPEFPGTRAVRREPRFPGALPTVWQVPARNPNFTGRGSELEDLAQAVAGGSRVTVQSLRGMGGVGKTQLATEYCYLHAGEYDLVYWVAAEEPATIPDQFTDLARQLGMDPAPDPEALGVQVRDQLRRVPGWLLVFDNADQVEDIGAWLPGGPLLPGIPGHVIVTTRRGGFTVLGQVMELDVIDLPAAVALLRTRVPHLSDEVGEQIAEELGQLPLALEQAAAYLDRSAMPPADYLILLRQRAKDLYPRGQVSGRGDTIATLWDITFERISSENPAAVVLLELCAYLAPEPIPLDLFTDHADLLPPPLAAAASDTLTFNDVIATLVDYSLVKRTQAGLQLHRLVQGVIRARNHSASSGVAAQADS
jgi:TIR domain